MRRSPAGHRSRLARRNRSLRLVHPTIQELERRQLLAGASVYVSDLPFVSASNDYGPVERDQTNGGNGAHDGQAISLRGVTYSKGLGTHAHSDVKIALDGIYDRFHAIVGVDDDAGGYGSVVFQVWADGAKLYDSGTVTGSTPTSEINVDVRGKLVLDLIVTDAGDGFNSDHADWADAQLRLASSSILPEDASFEDVAFANGVHTIAPSGSAWAFGGSAGIAGYGSAMSGAFGEQAPDGRQAAFLQGSTASITQTVSGWTAGSYRIAFSASQVGYVDQNFEVLLDNVSLGSYRPTFAKNQYERFTTDEINVTAGSHVIKFRAINSSGGANNTALIDDVAIEAFRSPDPSVGDGSFEAVDVGPLGYEVNPRSGTWSFLGPAGVALNQSAIASSNPASPSGRQVGFLQKGGSFAQNVVGWLGGPYQVVFSAAQRASNTGTQNLQVLVDGIVVGTFSPNGSAYQTYATPTFTVAAGHHVVSFRAPDNGSINDFVLIDDVVAGPVRPAILLDSGGSNTSRYEGGFVQLPYTIQSDADMTAYLAAHPIVANPVFDARFTPTSASYPAWFANNADSSWMAPTPGGMTPASLVPFLDPNGNTNPDIGCPQGLFYYTTNFFVPAGANPSEVLGHWAIDNPGMAIFLNGVPQNDFTNDGIFYSFSTFRLDQAALRVGMNTLTFVNLNGTYNATSGNPSGIRIEATLNLGLPVTPSTTFHSLSGRVFADANNDGKVQPGEPGLAGVTVALAGVDALGNIVNATTRTGTDGSYSFAGLAPGTYSVAETHPTGLIDGKVNVGSLGGTVGIGQISGIIVGGGDGRNYNFGLDRLPTFITTAALQIKYGNTYTYQPAATDPDGDVLTYKLLEGPADATFDTATGRIVWLPPAADLGTQRFTLQVSDQRGGLATQDFFLQVVTTINRPPMFTSTPEVDARVGLAYAYQATARDPDGDAPLVFTLVSASRDSDGVALGVLDPDHPFGITTAGLATWLPIAGLAGQSITVTLRVSDSHGGSSEQKYKLLPLGQVGNHAPVIVTTPVSEARVGLAYRYEVRAVDSDGDLVRYDFAAGSLRPGNMTLVQADGKTYVSWTPATNDTLVPVSVRLVASDGRGGSDEQYYQIIVRATGTGSIRGTEWLDRNGDGAFQLGEPAMVGIQVYLDLNDNGNLDVGEPFQVTAADDLTTIDDNESGRYRFDGLTPGSYIVRQVVPAGHIQTYPGNIAVGAGIYRIGSSDLVVSSKPAITFDEIKFVLPPGQAPGGSPEVVITDQYRGLGYGVTFGGYFLGQRLANANEVSSGANPNGVVVGSPISPLTIDPASPAVFTSLNYSSSTQPNLSGSPRFNGPIAILFDELQVSFGLVAASFDQFQSTRITVYGVDGGILGTALNTKFELNGHGPNADEFFGFAAQDGRTPLIKAVLLSFVAQEIAGFAIDDLMFGRGFTQTNNGSHLVQLAAGQVVNEINFGNKRDPSIPDEDLAIISRPSTTVVVTQPYQYLVQSYDRAGLAVRYELPVAPQGMAIDPVSGIINWIPTLKQLGDFDVVVRATDSAGRSALQSYSVKSSPINSRPRFTTQPIGPAALTKEWTYQVDATDPNGDPLTFVMDEYPVGATYNAATRTIHWTPTTTTPARFRMQVSDGRGGSDLQGFTLDVSNNGPPRFTSTPVKLAAVGQSWVYDITTADPNPSDEVQVSLDSASLALGLRLTPQPYPNSFKLQWTPNLVGTFEVMLTASDGHGGKATQKFSLVVRAVNAPNAPPEITSVPTGPAVRDRSYTYLVQADDPDGDTITWTLDTSAVPAASRGNLQIDSSDGRLTWTPQVAGSYDLKITVSAGQDTSTQSFTLIVLENAPPVITSAPVQLGSTTQSYSYSVSAADPNLSDTLRYRLPYAPDGMTINSATGQVFWTSPVAGTHWVTVVVLDQDDASDTQTFPLRITSPGQNGLPYIATPPRDKISLGQRYHLQLDGRDPDGDRITYHLISGPETMTVDAGGLVDWLPQAGDVDVSPLSFQISLSDGVNAAVPQTFSITVLGQRTVNRAPSFSNQPRRNLVAGEAYQYDADATDPDGDSYSFSIVQAPDGMWIDQTTGLIRWQPTLDEVGPHPFTFQVTDSLGLYSQINGSFNVSPVNRPPSIKSDPIVQATINQTYSYDVVAVDPDGQRLTYDLGPTTSYTGVIDINHATGAIRWTPSGSGTGHLEVVVTDELGLSVTQAFDVEILGTRPGSPPTITSKPTLTIELGATWTYHVVATDTDPGQTPIITLFTPSPLPAQMTFDTATSTITWTPTNLALAEQLVTFEVRASDGTYTTRQWFQVAVQAANHAPQVAPISNRTLTIKAPFAYSAQATDLDGDTVQWSLAPVAGRDYPTGMTIDPRTGRIDWIPIATVAEAVVIVMATDTHGKSGSATFSLQVVPDTLNPSVQIVLDHQAPITPGTRLTVVVQASDNAGVASRSLKVDGVLVPLDANNSASFVVRDVGTILVQATATDVNGRTGSATETFDVLTPITSPLVAQLTAYRGPGVTAVKSFDIPTVITAPIDILGTVGRANGTDPASYTLEVLSVDGVLLRTLVEPTTPTVITNDILGRFDPTVLANGSYILRLTARNGNAVPAIAEEVINVTGRLKLGNLHLSFVDLVVPVAGIPITLTRSYDTLNAGKLGDFGYGWTLDEGDFQLQISQPDGTLTGLDAHTPFHYGDHIVLTRPGKAPEGFTFLPEVVTTGGSTLPIGTQYYYAVFKADPGVADELMVSYTELIYDPESGDFLSTLDYGTPYNPADPTFGSNGQFTLRTRQGYQYVLDADSGRLANAIDRNDNMLTFDDNGIYSSSGRFVTFTRDSHGLIREILDQAGNRITYDYDDDLNLIAVNDQWSNKNHADGMPLTPTQFFYRTDANAPQHYIDHITDALNRPAATTEYDDQGRLKKVIDASGKTTTYIWDSVGLVQQVTDQLGHTTTITLDTRGNILRTVDPEGVTTVNTYDPVDHLKSQTTVVGQEDSTANGEHDDLKVTYIYVGDDLKQMIDPRGNVTIYDYNAYGQPTGTTTALGGVTSGYDDTGLLRSVRDVNDLTTTLDYDTKGNLTRIRDDRGATLATNTYNKFGDITSTTPVVGTTTYFDYDEDGNRVAIWSFDGTGASQVQILDLVRYKGGRVVGSLHAVLPAGNFITTDLAKAAISVQYVKWTTRTDSTADGLVATQVDRNGQETSYIYDRRGLLIQTRTVAAGSTVGILTRTYYNAAGQAIATTDPFVQGTTAPLTGTYTVYDKAGRVKETHRVKGLVINLTGSGSLVEAILASQGTVVTNSLTHFDSAGRVDLTTDSGGLQSKTTYDNYGEAVESRTQSIDQTGQVVWLVTRTVYDAMGRAVLTTDPYIESSSDPISATRTDYDSQGRAYQSVRLSGVFVSLSPVDHATSLTTPGTELWRTTTVYNSRGQIAQSIAANGQTTTYEYDQIGRQVAVIGTPVTIDGQLVSLRTETHFGDDGRVAWTQTNVRQYTNGTIDRSQAERTSYQYDHTGNVILTTYADGTTTSAIYNDFGRKISETNQLHQTRNFEYDAAGRLVAVTLPAVPDPNNNRTPTRPRYDYGYDDQGNQTLIRDPLGHETRFTFDAQGNQLSRTLPLGYGPDGKLGTADDSTLPEGNFTETAQYDDQGRVIEQVSFEGVVTTFHYDTQTDRLASKQFFPSTSAYANGTGTAAETWTYTYDAFSRTIQVVQVDTGGASRVTTTDYDDRGRLASVTTPEGTVNYRYDNLGRLREMFTGTAGAVLDDTQYGYDALGRLASVTVVKQNGVAFALNARPMTIYGYDLLGNLARKDLPNGGIEVYTYDALHHLQHQTQYAPDASPSNLADNPVVADYAYALRDDGTRSGAVETFYFAENGGAATPHQSTSTWTYDDLGRLVDEVIDSYDPTLDQHEHFIYDLAGNRLELTIDRGNDGIVDQDTTYQYDGNDRLRVETQVSSGGTAGTQVTTYGYDHTEQTSKDVAVGGSWVNRSTYAFDLQGKMAVVTATNYTNGVSNSVERTMYSYDADGILTNEFDETDANNDGTFETRIRVDYLNDVANATGYSQAIRVTTTDLVSGQVQKMVATTYGHDAIAQATTTYVGGQAQAPTMFVLGHDGHGSTRVLTDATGMIATTGGVWQVFVYDAYGNLLGMSSPQAATNLLYSGEMFNARIGQQYLRARWYDARTGMFSSLDRFFGKLQDPQSFHKYNYTSGNPIDYSDPTGLSEGLSGLGAVISSTLAFASNFALPLARVALVTTHRVLFGNVYRTIGTFITGLPALAFAYLVATGQGSFSRRVLRAADDLIAYLPWFIVPEGNSLIPSTPSSVILQYKNVINRQKAAPPELVASVLLAELQHYNIIDTVGDTFPGDDHSIGIAQIRIDTIRNHAKKRPDIYGPISIMDDDLIGALLLEPTTAIQLLGLEIHYLASNNGIDINADWKKGSDIDRDLLVQAFTASKDTGKYGFVDLPGFAQWGSSAYKEIVRNGYLK